MYNSEVKNLFEYRTITMENLTLIDLLTTITLIAGLIFAVVEVRHFRLSHKREAAITLMQSFLSSDYNNIIPLVFKMPEDLATMR